MAAAFNAGAEAIQAFSDLDKLLKTSEDWPAEKRIRAGERGGQRVEGFDLGNSPLDHQPDITAGKRLFMSTTNGTRCLERIQAAPTVLTAALTTRKAVVDHLLNHNYDTIWLVGSGWKATTPSKIRSVRSHPREHPRSNQQRLPFAHRQRRRPRRRQPL